jgi:hypothetical protein
MPAAAPRSKQSNRNRVPHLRRSLIAAKVGAASPPRRHPDRSASIQPSSRPQRRTVHRPSRSGGTPAFRLCLFLFFAVACSPPLPEGAGAFSLRPMKPSPRRHGLHPRAFSSTDNLQPATDNLLSSPSTPKNPHNSHLINHFPPKNSWHSSYAPLDTINIWIKYPSSFGQRK